MTRVPWLTLSVASAALAAQAAGAAGALEYDRAAIAAGAWWRIPAAHLAHWTWSHALWDVAAWTLFAGLAERGGRRALAAAVAAAALAIPLAIAVARPDIACYRGLSGLGSAAFALLVGAAARERRRGAAAAGAAAFALKLAHDAGAGALVADLAGAECLAVAHLAGAACGVAVALAAARPAVSGPRGPIGIARA